MRITNQQDFKPIIITLETKEERDLMLWLVRMGSGATVEEYKNFISTLQEGLKE